MKLYVLQNNVWDASDYLNETNNNPLDTRLFLYTTLEEAKSKAMALPVNNDIYNDCLIYEREMDTEEILKLSGADTLEDWRDALAEPYSIDPNIRNYGEDEKGRVAAAILEDPDDTRETDCANYNFDASLEGALLIFWSWEKYIGYARRIVELRYAGSTDTEAILTKKDKVFAVQCDILLTAEEVTNSTNIREDITARLQESSWKWTNPSLIDVTISNL